MSDFPILQRAKEIWAEREKGFPAFTRQTWEQGTPQARAATVQQAARELRSRPAPVDATPRKAEGFEARRAGSAVTAKPAGAQASVDPTQEETR